MILVVLFHAKLGFTGGYVGVDVFFVVSGYVITQLLKREFERCETSILKNFYIRRIYRLLPLIFVVTASVCIFSIFALAPSGKYDSPMLDVASVATATVFFRANFEMLNQNEYFGAVNPLQHMWSLAVEEQFYLFFPTVFIGINRILRNCRYRDFVLRSFLVICGAISFAAAVLLSRGRGSQFLSSMFSTTPQSVSFYLAPTRAWEFLVGCLLAVMSIKDSSKLKNVYVFLVIFGSLMILFSSLFFDSKSTVPGLPALIPVLGTVVIIYSGSRSIFARQIYSWKPLQSVGNFSYSWYVWHFPFIVFAEKLFPRSVIAVPISAIISIVPSVLTYRYIENPFRNARGRSIKSAFRLFVVGVVVVVGASTILRTSSSLLARRTPETRARNFVQFNGCPREDFGYKCVLTRTVGAETVMLLGDSQAAASSGGVAEATQKLNLNLAISTFDGCPPFKTDPYGANCSNGSVQESAIDFIAQVRPQIVILSNSLARYAIDFQSTDMKIVPFVVNSEIQFVRALVERNVKVIVILEVPETDFFLTASLLRPHISNRTRNLFEQSKRNFLVKKLSDGASNIRGVYVLETDSIFCPNGLCTAMQNGELLYDDNTHIGPYGSMRLVGPLISVLETIRNSND